MAYNNAIQQPINNVSDSDMEKFVQLYNMMNSALVQLLTTAKEIDNFQQFRKLDLELEQWKQYQGNESMKRGLLDELMNQLVERKEQVMEAVGPDPDLAWLNWSENIDNVAETRAIEWHKVGFEALSPPMELLSPTPPIEHLDLTDTRSSNARITIERLDHTDTRSSGSSILIRILAVSAVILLAVLWTTKKPKPVPKTVYFKMEYVGFLVVVPMIMALISFLPFLKNVLSGIAGFGGGITRIGGGITQIGGGFTRIGGGFTRGLFPEPNKRYRRDEFGRLESY